MLFDCAERAFLQAKEQWNTFQGVCELDTAGMPLDVTPVFSSSRCCQSCGSVYSVYRPHGSVLANMRSVNVPYKYT